LRGGYGPSDIKQALFLFPVTINPLLSCCLVYTAYTRPSARTRPYTRPVHDRVHVCIHHLYTPVPTRPGNGRVRAVNTCTRSVHTAVYTARARSCARLCSVYTIHVHGLYTAVHRPYVHGRLHVYGPCTHVYGPYTQPCTRSVHGCVYGRVHVDDHVHGRVHVLFCFIFM